MSLSPQEREKLRKKIKKLFQTEGNAEKSANGTINTNYSQKDKMNNPQKTGSPKKAPVKEISKSKESISKNVTKQQASKKKLKKSLLKDELKPMGFVSAPNKQNVDSKSNKTESFILKKNKQVVTKLQKEKDFPAINTKEMLSKQNGFVKAPKKQNVDGNAPKSAEFLSKKTKRKETKLEKEKPFPPSNTSPPKGTKQKMKNQVNENPKLKNSGKQNKVTKNINGENLENTRIKSNPQGKVPKSEIKSISQQIDTIGSKYKNINENQKKKDKKRCLSEDTFNNGPVISNKRLKLHKIPNYKNTTIKKSNQIKNNNLVQLDSSSSQESYGDSEMQAESSLSDESDSESEMQDISTLPEESDSEVHCKSSLSDESEMHCKSSLSEESDSEGSDFHENNVSSEEDESDSEIERGFDDCDSESFSSDDSFNYTMDNSSDYSSSNDSYNFNMNNDYSTNYDDYSDYDYELPSHVPEDLIIHQGTAIKRDLKPEDNISFESKESQIVELQNQQSVKIIYQPKAYEKRELLKLKYDEKTLVEVPSIDSGNCPKLVPIVDENGFQLYNPSDDELDQKQSDEEQSLDEYEYESDDMDDISLGSEYTELNSDDTDDSLSEDINEKYLKRGLDSDSDSSIDEIIRNTKHKVEIIDATGYKYVNKVDNSNDSSDNSLNDDIGQIPSIKLYANVDLNTECNILSTRVIDNEILAVEEFGDTKQAQNTLQSESSDSAGSGHEVVKKLQMETESIHEESPKVNKTCGQTTKDYNTKFFNAFDSNLVIVLLKDPFNIYGTVRLTLLAGTVEVYGHSLNLNDEVEIFSPRGCSVIEISAIKNICNISNENLRHLLEPYEGNFALADLETIANLYDCERDAVVLLKRNESRKKLVQQFRKFMNENVFPNISNIHVDRPLYNSEYLLRCMINTSSQEQKCLRLPEQWKQLRVSSTSRVMLSGGKGVGKSTLLRYLINRNLPQQILLIDLDIGQPEVFIPQTISCTVVKQPLLGPGFMLNLQPEMSYAIGHTNIALCAYKYIEAVRRLIAHCQAQEEYKEMPWLINTMGYNKGFGLELIAVIAKELPLTDVIQLQSSKEINNFESILYDHVLSSVPHVFFPEECERKEQIKYRLHVWKSAVEQESRYQKEWEMSAKDFRFAILLARLSTCLQGHADWLTDVRPLSASLDDIKVINLMDSSSSDSVEVLEKSLEVNLVYLCRYEKEDYSALKCVGIGVVRAIDFQVRQLYLIPALSHMLLKNVNCLAIGEMPLPSSLFTNQGPRVKNIAPFLYNTLDANASKSIKQIYHRPQKFLSGNHKAIE